MAIRFSDCIVHHLELLWRCHLASVRMKLQKPILLWIEDPAIEGWKAGRDSQGPLVVQLNRACIPFKHIRSTICGIVIVSSKMQ